MLGSKIDNLKLLLEHDINVPKFFVIKYSDFLNQKLDLDKSSSELKKELLNNIKLKYKNTLKCNKYAVRSSCNLEDSNNYSFAGQFDTYLNVSKEDLDQKIIDCFLSLYNDNVLSYVKEKNIDISLLEMNVIVQEMVDSDLSGVLFTANPQGLLSESVIAVSYGLGENVVQDLGDVSTYYFNNIDKNYYYENKDILSRDLILELIDKSTKIKELLGEYLDIEFAIKNNKIYFLQARTITTISNNNLVVLDNSNIVESYPNLSLPLTISFVHRVYSNVFRQLVRRVLKNDKELKYLDDTLNNMTGNVNGRVYYKISNWYTLLKFIPFNKKIIPIWQEMLGVKNNSVSDKKINISSFTRFRVGINYLKELFNSNKNMKLLEEEFNNISKYYDEKFNNNMSNEEIIKLFKKVEKKILNNWDITLVNDMYAFIYTGLLKQYLKKKYKDTYLDITNEYISGISNIESLKPIKELVNLAINEKNYSKEEFSNLKNNYIKLYGDRSFEELKLESKTFRTNPELLDEKIKEYQKDLDKLNDIYNDLNKEKSTLIKENFITKYLLKRVNIGISNREISRLNRSRIYGMVRSMFILMGKNLVKDKLLDNYLDIFYLSIDEIFNIDKSINYKNIIKDRKLSYDKYSLLPVYSRLIFMDHEYDKSFNNISVNDEVISSDKLYGAPASFGEAIGEVLVVDNINSVGDVKDKILVTKMTDPGWVFLLATAKGVISEKGSLLSHTAIISRELHIPSIVGVNNLLKTLHTGDIIKMNANTGEITVIKRC